MGNEQSVAGQTVPENGLRLSTLCQYHSEPGNDEGVAFSWFQVSTDVSSLALRGAHRWGYILSHVGGQRLFKDSRRRFFVLLDHYMCYFDSHAPESRMRGSIDLDKALCHLELLPRLPEPADIMLQGGSGAESDEHRVEISSRTGSDFSMILCFSSSVSLSDWMKSIFDVQQRKATFSPLKHGTGGGVGGGSSKEEGGGNDTFDVYGGDGDDDDDSGLPGSLPRRGRYASSSSSNSNSRAGGIGTLVGSRRGTLDSHPRRPGSQLHEGGGGGEIGGRGVPSSWADDVADDEARPRSPHRDPSPWPRSASHSSAWLGKASERLAGLPRGGRAAGVLDNLDEYGAFTTAQASIYEGWTRGLQPHGWGRMIFANGDCVEGWWEHDALQGSGEYTSHREGWTFRGDYAAGERHGPGRLVTADGDTWECEWTRGVVAPCSRGTHSTAAGELYHGGCGASADDPSVPCRAGQGRLRRRNGEQVDTRFRAGRAVDGAKGVVRFRNGAIFFGELQDARPHGYGELFLSSVKAAGNRTSSGSSSKKKRRRRKCGGSLVELDEMARDILWYKGDFFLGKPHGSGLVKYKDPSPSPVAAPTRASGTGAAAAAAVAGTVERMGVAPSPPPPPVRRWSGEIKEEGEDDGERRREAAAVGRGVREEGEEEEGKGEGGQVDQGEDEKDEEGEEKEGEGQEEEQQQRGGSLGVGATDEGVLEDDEEDEDDCISDSDDDEDDEEEDDDEEGDDDEEDEDEDEGAEEQEQDGGRRAGSGRRIGSGGSNSSSRSSRRADFPQDEEEMAGAAMRSGQRRRSLVESGSGCGSGDKGGADMEYEAEFVSGVMVRHDPSLLRLAALRFGRAEIRRLEALLRAEEDAMSRLRVRGLCLLCNAQEMDALVVGCRHRVLCMACAELPGASCPVCGVRITGKVVKTYST